MITYNQEDYIKDALEGVLNQVCEFEYEVILSNDASTDSSDILILDFINSHPNGHRVKYFYQKKNLGMNPNLVFAYDKCIGKYVAMCEGDDFWTDPYKLQKQVDFLESNPQFVITYHPVKILFQDGRIERDLQFESIMERSYSTKFDLAVLGNYIHTPSVVFRKTLNSLPETINKSPLGDFFLWMLISDKGYIKKLDYVMAVYRSGVGVFSSKDGETRVNLFRETLELLSETLSDKVIVEILKNKNEVMKYSYLPAPLKNLKNFSDSGNADVIKDFVSYDQLMKALWLKIKRKFK